MKNSEMLFVSIIGRVKSGMMDGHGFGIFGMIVGLIIMTFFIVGSVLLIAWIVKQFSTDRTSTTAARSNALEILKERFAKGEISKEEFSDMKKELLK